MAESSQKILVTGAAGFIGSRVCALLAQDGHEVVAFDSFNDAYDRRLKEWRWAQLEKQPGVELTRLDLLDLAGLTALFEKHGTARGPTAVRRGDESRRAGGGARRRCRIPASMWRSNVTGSLNLLELCRKFGVKKFVLASSSSLYGAGHPTPYREDLSTDRPLSPYAATKKAAELMAYTYHYLHGLDVSALRYFTVLRPGGAAGHGAAAVRAAHPRGPAHHGLRRWLAVARFHLRRRHRARHDRGAAAGRLRGFQSRLRPAGEAFRA